MNLFFSHIQKGPLLSIILKGEVGYDTINKIANKFNLKREKNSEGASKFSYVFSGDHDETILIEGNLSSNEVTISHGFEVDENYGLDNFLLILKQEFNLISDSQFSIIEKELDNLI